MDENNNLLYLIEWYNYKTHSEGYDFVKANDPDEATDILYDAFEFLGVTEPAVIEILSIHEFSVDSILCREKMDLYKDLKRLQTAISGKKESDDDIKPNNIVSLADYISHKGGKNE